MQKSLELVPEEVLEIICVSHHSSGDLKNVSCKRKHLRSNSNEEQLDSFLDLKENKSHFENPSCSSIKKFKKEHYDYIEPDNFTIFEGHSSCNRKNCKSEDSEYSEADTANFDNLSPFCSKQFKQKDSESTELDNITIFESLSPCSSGQLNPHDAESETNNFENILPSSSKQEIRESTKPDNFTIVDDPLPCCSKQLKPEYEESIEADAVNFENPSPSCSKQEATDSSNSDSLSGKTSSEIWSGVKDLQSLVWGAHNSTMTMEERRKYLAEPPVWPPGIRKSIRYKNDPPPPSK